MTDRCEITELLTDQCACPRHRGGPAPAEEIQTVGPAFEAWYPGHCVACEHPIRPGQQIARVAGTADPSDYVHADRRCER